jgi:hypothetical protein
MITYRGYQIIGTSGEYFVIVNGCKVGAFAHYSECESYINGIRY